MTDKTRVRRLLRDLLAQLRTWQDLPDPVHVIATIAAAATRSSDGEPCWLLLVAPPSSGKTEAVRLLDGVADARLDEVTPAGLLGWTKKGKNQWPSGVLARLGPRAMVTFGDLSTLLATSDRGGRDVVFGLMRRAYDGHVSRDIAPPGPIAENAPSRLQWSGRLTVIACVTGAIDRFAVHADQLGARWIYVRLPERSTKAKQNATRQARKGELAEHRRAAREAVRRLLEAVPRPLPDLPEPVLDAITDAALVTCWGRASVPRNGYGSRDIEGLPVVEEPMRLVQQLDVLARGILALGLPEEAAKVIARRVALDSMPEARHAVLRVLSHGEMLNISSVAARAHLDRKVARFQLEELAAIGVVTNDLAGTDLDEDYGPGLRRRWYLDGEDGALIAAVFKERDGTKSWDEMWCTHTPTPPNKEEKTKKRTHDSHASSHFTDTGDRCPNGYAAVQHPDLCDCDFNQREGLFPARRSGGGRQR